MRRVVIALVAVATVTVFTVDACHRRSLSEYEQREAVTLARVESERERAEAFKREAEEIAVELARKAPEIRTRIIEVQAATPDSLRNEPSIVLRDSLIADLRNEADGWRRAYEIQGEALALVEASRDSLLALVKDRPGERPWYVPTIGVGPYAGIDATGRPSIGPVAVTLSWRIRL